MTFRHVTAKRENMSFLSIALVSHWVRIRTQWELQNLLSYAQGYYCKPKQKTKNYNWKKNISLTEMNKNNS